MKNLLLIAAAALIIPGAAQAKFRITTTSVPPGAVGIPYSVTLAVTDARGTVTWSLSDGQLPPGLGLSAAGVISGTPTQAGSWTFKVQAKDSADSDTQSLTLTIAPPLAITTASLPDGTAGVGYSAPLTASGGIQPYTWSAAGLPAGLAVQGSSISGTPTTAGTYSVSLTVSDSSGATAQNNVPLTIAAPIPALTITTSSLPDATAGQGYSAVLNASGGVPPYTWSASGLPSGLTLSASTGTISGTPKTAGSYTIQATATDSAGKNAKATLPLTVLPAVAPLTIDTQSLPSGVVGQSYSARLTASGGTPPYTWSAISGALPPGLNLSADGTISGTPALAGAYDFRVQVTDAAGRKADTALRITISAAIRITTTDLPGGTDGSPYSATLQAAGGTAPYVWTIVSGALPTGLTLSRSGVISGTPTSAGSRTFTVQVTDAAGQTASAVFTIAIGSTLSISSPSTLPATTAGSAYTYPFMATGGAPPYSWSVTGGTVPPGLALDVSGLLSGHPAQAGNFSFVVTVSDQDGQSAAGTFSLSVTGALSVLTDATLPGAGVSVPYSFALSAGGGSTPYQWSVTAGALPPGLRLSTAGAISGTPTSAGTFGFTVQVRDAAGAMATKDLSLTVTQSAKITSPQALPSAQAGAAYSYTLQAAGGAAPYRWSLLGGTLPAGLTLDAATGSISGTPTATGDFSFTIRVQDANNSTDSQVFTLSVTVTGTPGVRLTGVPSTGTSLQQYPIALTLDRTFPVTLSGRLTLSFAADAAVPADDPAIQFSTGGRSVDFTVPANTTQVPLPSGLMLQTGSIAGTITVSASVGAGTTMAEGGTWTTRIARTAPVIRTVKLVRTTTGFEVWVTGYSNSRELGNAAFRFQQGTSGLSTTDVQLDFTSAAGAWYNDAGSRVFGSQFTIVQPFTINGDQNAVAGVTVTLKNALGTSQAVSAQF